MPPSILLPLNAPPSSALQPCNLVAPEWHLLKKIILSDNRYEKTHLLFLKSKTFTCFSQLRSNRPPTPAKYVIIIFLVKRKTRATKMSPRHRQKSPTVSRCHPVSSRDKEGQSRTTLQHGGGEIPEAPSPPLRVQSTKAPAMRRGHR